MPRTLQSGSPSLQIDVASPPSWTFTAGGTIIGTIIRRSPIVTPDAAVTLTLIGRAKTKIEVKRKTNNSTHTDRYRGRWSLVGAETLQVLHRGPLHLAPGGTGNEGECLSWPFSMTIPTRPMYSLSHNTPGAETYLPLATLAGYPLPGTFYSSGRHWRTKSEGFVEYYLECVLQYTRGGSHETCTATVPISLSHPPSTPIYMNPKLQIFQQKVQTQRLFPDMRQADLSFKQRTQKFFSSSKVPTFGYQIQVHSPSMIYLGDPSPIPFVIEFSPYPGATSPAIQDVPQEVRLNWVSMVLKPLTDVLAPGNFSTSHSHTDNQSEEYDLGLEAVFDHLENPIAFDSANGAQRVDVGTLLQLVLHPRGLQAGNYRRLATVPEIHPDFVTYNIRHAHLVEWQLSFTVAEETKEMEMEAAVLILPPPRVEPRAPSPEKIFEKKEESEKGKETNINASDYASSSKKRMSHGEKKDLE